MFTASLGVSFLSTIGPSDPDLVKFSGERVLVINPKSGWPLNRGHSGQFIASSIRGRLSQSELEAGNCSGEREIEREREREREVAGEKKPDRLKYACIDLNYLKIRIEKKFVYGVNIRASSGCNSFLLYSFSSTLSLKIQNHLTVNNQIGTSTRKPKQQYNSPGLVKLPMVIVPPLDETKTRVRAIVAWDFLYLYNKQLIPNLRKGNQSGNEALNKLANQKKCVLNLKFFTHTPSYTPFFFNCSPPKVVRGIVLRVYHMLTYSARHTNSKFRKISVFG
eukprot:sb/3467970/